MWMTLEGFFLVHQLNSTYSYYYWCLFVCIHIQAYLFPPLSHTHTHLSLPLSISFPHLYLSISFSLSHTHTHMHTLFLTLSLFHFFLLSQSVCLIPSIRPSAQVSIYLSVSFQSFSVSLSLSLLPCFVCLSVRFSLFPNIFFSLSLCLKIFSIFSYFLFLSFSYLLLPSCCFVDNKSPLKVFGGLLHYQKVPFINYQLS